MQHEHKVWRKTFGIAFHRLQQDFRLYAVESGEIGIEHYALSA